QVVVGGRSKYLINGVNAANSRVQDLFCSVGLNVNNPHFLIMQGQITKVLNMKPPEILAMIEEAAGTRMYECKKIAVQKTIEKKEFKLKSIQTVLHEEISPTLQKLKEERASYLEYQKVVREIEHLSRFCVAYQFFLAEETKISSTEVLYEIQSNVEKFQESRAEIEQKVKQLNEDIAQMEKEKDKEVGGRLRALEAALSENQRVNTKARSALDLKTQNLRGEEVKYNELVTHMQKDSKVLLSKEKEVKNLEKELNVLLEESEKDARALAAAQQHFNAVSAGLSSNKDGEEATLSGQMMICKNEISKAVTEAKQAEMKLNYAQKELKAKEAEVNKMDEGYKKDRKAFEAVEKMKITLEKQINELNYSEEKGEALLAKKKALISDISRLRELSENLMAKFPHLQFTYKYPEKNWDPNHVKGPVVSLFTVKDLSNAKALEAVAGGKLYNIIVDTEVTGKRLLEKGELKHRYTIIPLNKISARCVQEDTVKLAQRLAGHTNLDLALRLIVYESELQKAMEYVFGTTLVCNNMDNAKKVTFDKRIMTRSVTLDGDVFDPQGTLHGGNCWFYSYNTNNIMCASSQTAPILSKLQEVKDVEIELKKKEFELAAVENELSSLKMVAERYQQLKQQWEMKSEEAELLHKKLHQSAYHKQEEELLALRKTIVNCEETLKKTEESKKKAEKKYKELEDKIKNAEAESLKERKNAEQKLDNAKKKAATSSKKIKDMQQEVKALVLELEEMKQEQLSYKQQITAAEEAIKSYQDQVNAMMAEVAKTEESVERAQKELAKQKEVIALHENAIKDKSAEMVKYREQNNELQLKVKELEHSITKCQQEAADAAAKVDKMLKEYKWIASDRPLFGQPNTAYDFKSSNPKEASQKLQKLQDHKEKLGRNVNMRAMNMLSDAEERYNDLMKKKRIVENDKIKILAVIEELDRKKKQALDIAWKKVNEDFGSIFSTLLPGARAVLAASKTHNGLVGMEFRVALGNTWKENLTELSGGQRSLVALSLILAMLLFRPAPVYILDEVDAALDLSHTQNIGQMLQTHFKHSQFIVVSLKDGMFNNANVLYKTRFVDGVSTIARYNQIQNGKIEPAHKKDE
ncbi:SMC2 protein, partial [Donacobius atricapilla]|nr:SMC2 protein [Donacobius atricapilla]